MIMEIARIEFSGKYTTVRWGGQPSTPEEEEARFRCSLIWWIINSSHPKAAMIRELVTSPEMLEIIIKEYETGDMTKNETIESIGQ